MQTIPFSRVRIILSDSYVFFWQHVLQIATLCLPFIFVTTVFDFLLGNIYESTGFALVVTLALNLLVYPIYTAALIQLMARRARKEAPQNGDLIVAALQQWAPLFALKAAMVLLIGVGFSLLILPGIWLGVRLVFAEFYLVLFGMNPREAIVKSFEGTRDQFALVFILLIMTYVPILVLSLASDQILQTISGNGFFRIIVNTGWSFIGLLVHVVLFRAFMQVLSEKQASTGA